MRLLADLHIHSRFSRATSRELTLPNLHRAALEKGIGLVGTGDFTHPGWMGEIKDQLEPAEPGFFRLKPELANSAEQGIPTACVGEVRFVLQVEISNIYKADGKVRKNHNLVYLPSLGAAASFSKKLETIGNLASDGRPILGLDARDLLEITMETDDFAFLVPAHIWTPWFSMLGSKSGFDSLQECFRDLSGEIFAAETGLSSDPPMNWRVSDLDHLTLVSNSDAHSPGTLGREVNVLEIDPGFEGMRRALATRQGMLGTVEFYPEEGKYHLDGHRKCGVRLEPEETLRVHNRCPECGGEVTVGVMSRVLELADRRQGFSPGTALPFQRLVPLAETVAQVLGVGAGSKRVRTEVDRLRTLLGPELTILRDISIDEIQTIAGVPVAEAVRRVRSGELSIAAGYDGEFGSVQIFSPAERDELFGQLSFLPPKPKTLPPSKSPLQDAGSGDQPPRAEKPSPTTPAAAPAASDPLSTLDEQQRAAAEATKGPLLVVAGPGTGKTRTLVSRIAHQVRTGVIRPEQVLAVTFTNQARLELSERILREVPGATEDAPTVTTFHGLGRRLLASLSGHERMVLTEDERLATVRKAAGGGLTERVARAILGRISLSKQSRDPWEVLAGDQELLPVIARYQELLEGSDALDVDDLVLRPYQHLATDPASATRIASRWRAISVDEYQDVNDVQAALVSLLSPEGAGLCVIGDPNQAIYGFRGAKPGHFARFADTFDDTHVVLLETSYRLTEEILRAAASVVGSSEGLCARRNGPPVELFATPTANSEAEQIIVRLERVLGGTSHFALDSGRAAEAEQSDVGFGDVAILCRTRTQHKPILEALDRSGIPCRSVGEDEPHDPRSQKVAVMTMHAAKGREFELVFVTGVEQGLLPLEREGLTVNEDEERRLLYVAMTRARRLLVMSYAENRTLWGRRLPGNPSSLLADLPPSVIRTAADLPDKGPSASQLRLF